MLVGALSAQVNELARTTAVERREKFLAARAPSGRRIMSREELSQPLGMCFRVPDTDAYSGDDWQRTRCPLRHGY